MRAAVSNTASFSADYFTSGRPANAVWLLLLLLLLLAYPDDDGLRLEFSNQLNLDLFETNTRRHAEIEPR